MFAGLALDGTALTIDDDANELFYGKPDVLASDIICGQDQEQRRLGPTFHDCCEHRHRGQTCIVGDRRRPHQRRARSLRPCFERRSRTDAPARSQAAHSFPMEDPNPGREPT